MSNMAELRTEAKSRGINTFQMSKAGIEAKLAEGDGKQQVVSDDAREARPIERKAEGRQARIPMGTMRMKLSYPSREGYHRRWFNDADNRIHDAEMAGYTQVEGRSDGRDMKVSRRVGTHTDGSPLVAHLMEIRQEFYDEDQALKARAIDEIDATIQRGEPRGNDVDPGKFYTPSEGITVSVDKG